MIKIIDLMKDIINRKKLFRYSYSYGFKPYDFKRELALFWDTPLPEKRVVNTNKEQYEHLVAVNGFGYSGSSAVTDFLDEFSEATALGGGYSLDNNRNNNNFECLFWIRDGGVLYLEEAIFSKRLFYRDRGALQFSICALRHFFSSAWIYDEYYLQRSKEFLFDLLEHHWRWNALVCDWYEKKGEYIPKEQPDRFIFNDTSSFLAVDTVYKDISLKEYRTHAKKYMQDIFKHIPSKKFLVCDQLLVGTYDCDMSLYNDYFDDLKIIYVYRDPRDQYTRYRKAVNAEVIPKDPYAFVAQFKKLIRHVLAMKDEKNVLLVRLEEFITDYDRISKQIIDFLGLDPATHVKKFQYFNPEISGRKIGCHKDYSDQEAIKIIGDELKEFCWESK